MTDETTTPEEPTEDRDVVRKEDQEENPPEVTTTTTTETETSASAPEPDDGAEDA